MAASHAKPKPKNGKRLSDEELAEFQEWLEEHKGPMFKIEWFRIILDEAQYTLRKRN